MSSNWILGTPQKEFSFFYFPALFAILLTTLFPSWSDSSIHFAFIATALVDSGHVYTTFWRWGDKALSAMSYPLTVLIVFLSISTLYFLGVRQLLWSGVVYLTVFHHIRQVYGFSRWYERLNQRYDRLTSLKVYLLAIIPFVAFHFRDLNLNYYSSADLMMYPHADYFRWALRGYLAVIAAIGMHEIYLWRSGIQELNRVFYFCLIATTYGYSFFLGDSLAQVLFPLLFVHGVAYLAVMGEHIARERLLKLRKALLLIGLTSLIFGTAESLFEHKMDQIMSELSEVSSALLIGGYLTPLISHYVFDAFLWRRRTIAPLANK